MTKKHFSEILKECGYTNPQIESLWNSRPSDDLDETELRKAASETLLQKFVADNGRMYEEVMPGVYLHRRDLENPSE